MALPPGYLLTWHTYGTWLHGDADGSVDRSHNVFGSERLQADGERFDASMERLKSSPLLLTDVARRLVDGVMRRHCQIRAWDLRALNVRSNHVHVVIAAPIVPPEIMVKQLKEWGTRKLREHAMIGPTQRAWAAHASTAYLFEPGSIDRAIAYTRDMQDGAAGREDWAEKLGLRKREREP
ncbi:MAG: transposase [Phycisphaerales bacterium]|nr:transposase [Phycisphaerales bacterium]